MEKTAQEFYKFPPFFTLQPVEATRQKQLSMWRSMVLEWFAKHPGQTALSLDAFELFENKEISRKLDTSARLAVAGDLIASGHGQWQEEGKTLYIFVRTPEDWASIILQFVQSSGLTGTIYTLYELHSGDLTRGSELDGIDPMLCLRAVQALEKMGKAQVFHNDEAVDETGVKFI